MPPRSPWARLALGAVGMAAAIVGAAGACADVLHVTYRVSLIGLPIGAVNLNADLTPTSYSIQGDAKLTGLARLLNNARGASAGNGAIVQGHVSPATFATIAASSNMTRTIRMALAGNAVTGVDISPPYEDRPDRVPLGPGQRLRGPGRGVRRALCPHSRPSARPPGDQVHGRQQGPRGLAGADRTRPRADSVPGFGAHDDWHDRRRGDPPRPRRDRWSIRSHARP